MDVRNLRGLPTTRRIITSIIDALQKPETSTANPLDASGPSKNVLLTLHVLFQNELLPALDLLDRGLVTRLSLSNARATNDDATAGTAMEGPAGDMSDATRNGGLSDPWDANHAYYVRSSQQQSTRSTSRYRSAAYEHTSYYEVRLDAWTCSCPAFAFSAFPATVSDVSPPDHSAHDDADAATWTFGGLTRGTDMPVCKHLLACVLVEHTSMFADMVEKRIISADELAGWAAGWGD